MNTIVYIDGYNLYYSALRGTSYKWLDLLKLSTNVIKSIQPNSHIVQVRYFTSPVLTRYATHGKASHQAQNAYIRAHEELYADQFEVILGKHNLMTVPKVLVDSVSNQINKDNRVVVWDVEEKHTDVQLALEMYRDVSKGRCQQIVLCSNDSDFTHAIKSLIEDFPTLQIGVMTPIVRQFEETGNVLPNYAIKKLFHQFKGNGRYWFRDYLTQEELAQSLLPAKIPTSKKPILKPDYW